MVGLFDLAKKESTQPAQPRDGPLVIQQFRITNWDLLRLINGGTLDNKGGLFSVQTVRMGESAKQVGKQQTVYLTLQIVTNGIDNPVARRDVVVKKETVIEKAKPKEEVQPETIEIVDKVNTVSLL